MEQSAAHRWFRFRLRTMLLLVMTGCCVLAWLSVQLKWNHERQAALKRLHSTRQFVRSGSQPRRGLPYLAYLGEREYTNIDWVRMDATDAKTARELRRLFPEASVAALEEIQFFEMTRVFMNGRRVKTMHPLTFR